MLEVNNFCTYAENCHTTNVYLLYLRLKVRVGHKASRHVILGRGGAHKPYAQTQHSGVAREGRFCMNESVIREMESAVCGKVLTHDDAMMIYSVDASAYQIVPDMVVIPADEDDVVNAILVAGRTRTPITPRGAGTGLVGGALNTGIILDMRNLDMVNVDGDRAVVGVGTTRGLLDHTLNTHGKIFAPNPSIGAFCSVGGMLGNNSGGIRSVKYGSVIDNVTRITFVDGTGETITLPDDRIAGQKILDVANLAQISRFPQVKKNSSGYRLDKIRSIEETHRILIGSEGTLGVILSAELCLIDEPKHRRLFVLGYPSLAEAMVDCLKIVKTDPSALEFLDRHVLGQMDVGLDSCIECVLLVEYDEDIRKHIKILESVTVGRIVADSDDDAEMIQWWNHRNAALHHILSTIPTEKRTPHMIDDAAVPLERINDLFCILDSINRRYKTNIITFGHAGDGNIHARLVMDNADIKTMKQIAYEYCDGIISLGGTITAEHGDGFASSEFVKRQYGNQNYDAFKAAKKFFDPYGILNPGKKITGRSAIMKNLSSQHTFSGG